jgi:hypothetical protein
MSGSLQSLWGINRSLLVVLGDYFSYSRRVVLAKFNPQLAAMHNNQKIYYGYCFRRWCCCDPLAVCLQMSRNFG